MLGGEPGEILLREVDRLAAMCSDLRAKLRKAEAERDEACRNLDAAQARIEDLEDELRCEVSACTEFAGEVAALRADVVRLREALKALIYKPPGRSKTLWRVEDGRTVEEMIRAALKERS